MAPADQLVSSEHGAADDMEGKNYPDMPVLQACDLGGVSAFNKLADVPKPVSAEIARFFGAGGISEVDRRSTASTLSVVRRHSCASFAPANPEITGSYGLRLEGSQVVRERSHYLAMPILRLPALLLGGGRGPYLAATCVRRPRPDNARSILAWQRSPAQHELAPLS